MALQLTAAGSPIAVAIESIGYEEKIDDPVTCTFDVPDTIGYNLTQYQEVQVTDTLTSTLLYDGFIEKVSDQALPGNLGTKIRSVTCTGNRWRAEKIYWTGPEFNGWMAGDVAAELHRVKLIQEGVIAAYALRHDFDTASFGQGTLVGTLAANNQLTLSPSGSDFTQTEAVTSDFSTGTLTNVVAASNALKLQSYTAIKFSGSAGAALDNNNLFTSYEIWKSSSGYTLVSQDRIYCDVWISSSSSEIKAALDLQFSDGTWMRQFPTEFQDQEVISMDTNTDLKGWADDQWYSRMCIVPSTKAGKVVVAAYIVFEGDKGGDYLAYFKNIKITDSTGNTIRANIFTGSTMNATVKSGSNGYYNVKIGTATVYAENGNRVSPSRSITSVGIVKGSVISWVEKDAVQPAGNTQYPQQVLIEASYDDGATYQACVNHQPLPGLIVGMNTSGRSIILRQTLAVGGPNPEMAPILDTCSFTVYTAAAATKTDYVDIRQTQAQLAAGTLTNATSYSGVGLQTTGYYKNWDDGTTGTIAIFGLGVSPAYGIQTNYFFNRADSSQEVRARLDDAGTWQNFIAEVDVHIFSSTGQTGLEYRTTSFVSGSHRYAYAVQLSGTQVILSRGSNGGADTHTDIATVSINLTVNSWYRLKVVVNGSNHKVFINDVQFINATDATYSAAGNFLLWAWDNAAGRFSGHYDNFGVVGYESDFQAVSSWTTPALALSGTLYDSRINWNADVPSSSQLIVESTLDNGVTWTACTNGGQIPSLDNGYNAAGKSLKIRYTMTNQSVNLPIVLMGHSVFVIGQYSASGTRISPVLALDPAGTIGSSSVTWQATQPTGTGVAVATSPDNISYTGIAASGNPVVGLVTQGPMVADDFDVNSAANYTATFWSGGVAPVFSIDAANSRMRVTSGTNGIILWNTSQFPIAADVYLELITNQVDIGGPVWRYTSVDNCYYATYRDNSASTNPNTVTVRKRVAATDTQILAPTTLPVTFTRDASKPTYHTLKVTMAGSLITVYFDGLQVAQVTDTSLTAAGQVGIRQSSATESDWYSVRAQALGGSAVGKNVYSKLTLTSTDPTGAPVVSGLVVSVRGPDIMTGALISSTDYAYKKKISECLSDVAGQSKYNWRIDKNKKLAMKDRAYSPAPWPLYSADPTFKGITNPPTLVRTSPMYRNRQYVTGAIDLQSKPESKPGDGTTQSWALAFEVDSIVSLSLDGNPQTFGIQGVDTGKQFYYQPGQNSLAQDSSQTPPVQGQLINLVYIARVPYISMRENTSQQAALALIDGTSGIVEASEDCGGRSKAEADTIAQAKIDAYAILSVDWSYSTERSGLAPGNLQTIFIPEFGQVDVDVLITGIKTSIWADVTGALNYLYDVSTTSGANIGTWQRIFAQAA